MKTKTIVIAGNVLFCIGLALPFVQKVTHAFPELPLHGVEQRAPLPALSAKSWFDGSYGRAFESYFAGRIGFRGYFVRIYNQINMTLWGRLPERGGTQVLVGRDNWLFERAYVNDYLKPDGMRETSADVYAARLRELQTLLANAGVSFIFVISPSKAELLPEYLPPALARRPPFVVPPGRVVLVAALERHGVRYVDAHAFFERVKPEAEALFAPGGTHWNYYGSFLVWQEIVRVLRASAAFSWPVPELADVIHGAPQGSDDDLAKLLNVLWMHSDDAGRIPYPVVRPNANPADEKPAILMIGDSFSYTLVDSILYTGMNRNLDLLYYYKRQFSYPPGEGNRCVTDHMAAEVGPLDRTAVDWNALLLDKQLVILECNEILLRKWGWGFVEDALAFLKARESDGSSATLPNR